MINTNCHTSWNWEVLRGKTFRDCPVASPFFFLIQSFLNRTSRNYSHGSIMIVSTGTYVEETRVYNTCPSGSYWIRLWQTCLIVWLLFWLALHQSCKENVQIMVHLCRPSLPPAEWLCYPRWGHEPPFGNHWSRPIHLALISANYGKWPNLEQGFRREKENRKRFRCNNK